MTFMNWVNQSESCITRNKGQIVILAAIDKSVSPNSLKAQCMCPKSILITLLNHCDKFANLVISSIYGWCSQAVSGLVSLKYSESMEKYEWEASLVVCQGIVTNAQYNIFTYIQYLQKQVLSTNLYFSNLCWNLINISYYPLHKETNNAIRQMLKNVLLI